MALPEEKEGGFLDYLIEGIAATEEMQKFIESLNQNTESMTVRLNEHSSQLQKLNQSPGPGGLSQRYKIVRESARGMNAYSDSIEEDIDRFAHKTNEFVNDFTKAASWTKSKATPQDEEAIGKFKEAVKSLYN